MTQSHNLHHRRAAAAAQRRAPVPEPQLGFDPTAVFGGPTRTRGGGKATDICENEISKFPSPCKEDTITD